MHKEHKQFTEAVFKQLCERAEKDLPDTARNSEIDWETRQVAVLEHLLSKVQNFCGLEEGFRFDDLSAYPRTTQIKQQIIGIVDFDLVHEHPTMGFFYKQPIIEDYVRKAIGERPE
ncbi:MAG: hypothetical protein AABN95_04170 [Acidobacteriota bacterium]